MEALRFGKRPPGLHLRMENELDSWIWSPEFTKLSEEFPSKILWLSYTLGPNFDLSLSHLKSIKVILSKMIHRNFIFRVLENVSP